MNLASLTIVCAITIVTTIGFSLLPELFVQIKAENNAVSGNPALLTAENATGSLVKLVKEGALFTV